MFEVLTVFNKEENRSKKMINATKNIVGVTGHPFINSTSIRSHISTIIS